MKQQNTQQPEATNLEEVVGKSEAFINKYKMQIILAIAAVVVLVVGSILYQTYVSEPRTKEAAESMFKAQAYFAAADYTKALEGDEEGNMGFKQIIDEYSGTPSADLANAYAGLSLAQSGNYEEAISYLKAFSGDDMMVAPGVLSALANCYANTGDLDAAASKFMEAAKKADNITLSPYNLLQAGLIYEKQGDKAKALAAYTQIKEVYPTSLQAMDIEKYINRVK
ncbi:MAG: tetratricopeptide repeat protein [Bacteroidaceae bacterium]|nr:tetratricopeptide repeat protein [Bacteroidaceae bacterium]MBQ8734961.1 tetratricopeptide repeat protein [Bacteroidaceae bacterium]